MSIMVNLGVMMEKRKISLRYRTIIARVVYVSLLPHQIKFGEIKSNFCLMFFTHDSIGLFYLQRSQKTNNIPGFNHVKYLF